VGSEVIQATNHGSILIALVALQQQDPLQDLKGQ
jgi:hypothetical protein